MKKWAVLVFIAMISIGNIFAGGASESIDSSSTFEFDGTYPIKTDEPVKVTFWIPLNSSVSKVISNLDENIAYQKLQENIGVDIEFIHPPVGQEQEAFNLMIASGDYPDIIGGPDLYQGGAFQGLSDGVYADLTELLPKYAPDYWGYVSNDEVFKREITNDNGQVVLIQMYKNPVDPPARYLNVKQKNLDLVGEDLPETIEDYERLFQKFLDAGIVPFLLDASGIEEQFVNLFGVNSTEVNGGTFLYRDENGKIQYGPYQEGFKDYLSLMNDWYEKGYISKDFASLTQQQKMVLFDTDQIGIFADAIVKTYNRNELQGDIVVPCPHPREYEGQPLHYGREAFNTVYSHENMVAIAADSPNKELAVAVMNYFFTEEGAELLNWGVEGVNWDWVDGERVYNDTMLNNPLMDTETASYYYKAHFAPKLTYQDTVCHANLLKSLGALNARMMWADDENYDADFLLPNLQFTDDELNTITDIQVDLDTYVKEMILKFIIGAEPLNKFGEFLEMQKALGVEELIAVNQAAYDRYLER